ncbi:MAG TPA: hypothetical protein VF162_01570, partial [Streptosporangiaceae bacterium]
MPDVLRPGIVHGSHLACTMRALYFRFAKLVFEALAGTRLDPSGSRLDPSMISYRLLTGPPT